MYASFRGFLLLLITIALLGCSTNNSTPKKSEHGAEKLDKQEPEKKSAELFLPAEPPQGKWVDPDGGARWEELRRQIGIELSRRKEVGPVRCMLKTVQGADTGYGPELEVTLTNTSDQAVTLKIHQWLLDLLTFIFRAPDDSIVSSFCSVGIHSTLQSRPPIILKPGESKMSDILLSSAADHGYQPLRPGLYSLEAVFHDKLFAYLPVPEQTMLARSNRILVRVGEMPEKP